MFPSSIKDRRHKGEDEIRFFSTWSCPFCQIAWIGLNHLKVNYQLIDIDVLNDQEASMENQQRLLKFNPTGTVPTLSVDGQIHTESIDAVAFLHNYVGKGDTDPAFVTDSLLKDAYTMRQRLVSTYFSVFSKSSPTEEEKVWEKFEDTLSIFAIQIHDDGYFKSPTMNIVDVTVFPFVVRLCLIKRFRRRELDGSLPWVEALMSWRERMWRRVEVGGTVAAEADMVEEWRDTLMKIGARVC